jgi:5-(carboxyamino)imidazole ribonucleotide mutase
MAAAILSLNDQNLAKKLDDWRSKLSNSIPDEPSND